LSGDVLLAHKVIVARSHALWVIGALGQAYFHGLTSLQQFDLECRRLRVAFVGADADEAALEKLKLETATIEEFLAGLAAKRS
jgi:hypothetical protein